MLLSFLVVLQFRGQPSRIAEAARKQLRAESKAPARTAVDDADATLKLRYGSEGVVAEADEPVLELPDEVRFEPLGPIDRVESVKAQLLPEQRHLPATGSHQAVSQLLEMRVRTEPSLFFCGGLGCCGEGVV